MTGVTDDPRLVERLHRVALCQLTEPGDVRVANLISELGPGGLYRELVTPSVLATDSRTRSSRADAGARLADLDPQAILDAGARRGLRFVIPGDEEWPTPVDDLCFAPYLQERGGVPLGLWVRGALRLNELGTTVAVVGTRDSTAYGAELAAEIAASCGRAGVTVISGAANGIDSFAHRGAMAVDAPTVAVLACGADRAYPQENRALIDEMTRDGAVVSEVGPDLPAMRMRFLARNRIIAALSLGTVVVEAAVRSGALNTSNWAERLNRHVMGVPGPVSSEVSRGVHELLRRGGTVVTSGADVLELLGVSGSHLLDDPRTPQRRRDRLTARERQILDAVPVGQAAITTSIARTAGVDALTVSAALNRFVQRGLVERVPAGWQLTSAAVRG